MRTMDIQNILTQLDEIFARKEFYAAEPFLKEKIEQSKDEGDVGTTITLLNELIGFYRDASRFEDSVACCKEVLALLKQNGYEGSIAYATSLLNVANAYRAAGLLKESMSYYQEVQRVYQKDLGANDFGFASLYNNWSLLYQEMGDFKSAADCLYKALEIVEQYENARIELAVTHSNIAASLLKVKEIDRAVDHLEKALKIFEQDEVKDFHYSAALAALGEACYLKGDFEGAKRNYEKALTEIEKNMGRTKAYETVWQNLQMVCGALKESPSDTKLCIEEKSGLEQSREFYETYGKAMICEQFATYEDKIAVGLVGEGSQCLGFDDEISRDHDYSNGFCMWLDVDTYKEIGESLESAYRELMKKHGRESYILPEGRKRYGVRTISDFYESILGIKGIPETESDWLSLEDWQLRTATNGQVFYDKQGKFSEIRNALLKYYPDSVWKKKLALSLMKSAQAGQYNYKRALQRKEKVTAQLMLADYMKSTMEAVYLINRTYAPYSKWLYKGMDKLPVLPEVMDIFRAITELENTEDILATIEIVAQLILHELREMKLVTGEDTYLEAAAKEILCNLRNEGEKSMESKGKIIDAIVKLEWEAFDLVKNEGGRADCQNDFGTFQIMRKSQYMAWEDEVLESFLNDLLSAKEIGRNLIEEKYARQMESTDLEAYQKISLYLPQIPEDNKMLMEGIIRIQVEWMEEFAEQYPKLAGNARSIHSSEDSRYNTSFETYLRGELSTYSDNTLYLYGRMIEKYCKENKNLTFCTMQNMVKLYGYTSLEDAEIKI